ncbi:MAG: hypothetical protein Q7U04_11695, partial [Bacteriovorax sp.]|nr:hypothetical protein [Bacteriovorax sp.]
MKLGNLKSIDTSLIIISGEEDLQILGITDSYQLNHHHLIFIKNKNFLAEWLNKNKKPKSQGVIFEKKFLDLLNEESKNLAFELAYFVATVTDVNLAMSYFSKPFYDQKIQKINDIVDGRQMGSAVVDSSAWIAQGAFIGENVVIHSDVKIHPGVVIMSGAEIG